MKKCAIGLAIILMLLSAAAGIAQETEDYIWVAVPRFGGTWYGRWISHSGDTGRITATIRQNGTILYGTLRVTNTDCGTVSTKLTGSVLNTTARFRATYNCYGDHVVMKFTRGKLSSTGTRMSGNYNIYVNGSLYDWGTFSVHK